MFPTAASEDRGAGLRAVVLYEDRVCRDRALGVCDRIMQELEEEVKFELSCWKFDFLADAGMARHAAEECAKADVIIFAAHAGGGLSATVTDWVESWVARRAGREGMLVALVGLPGDARTGITPIHLFLRDAAHRAGMDYLPHSVLAQPENEPASVESVFRRSHARTALLDGILGQVAPVRQWGLNE
jgi:hypothetical protein